MLLTIGTKGLCRGGGGQGEADVFGDISEGLIHNFGSSMDFKKCCITNDFDNTIKKNY